MILAVLRTGVVRRGKSDRDGEIDLALLLTERAPQRPRSSVDCEATLLYVLSILEDKQSPLIDLVLIIYILPISATSYQKNRI